MTAPVGRRRLAAVAVADVVGYSRMMAEDEDGTLASRRAHLRVTEPVIINRGAGQHSLQFVSDQLQYNVALCAAYTRLGRSDSAHPHVEAVLEARPGLSCSKSGTRLPYATRRTATTSSAAR